MKQTLTLGCTVLLCGLVTILTAANVLAANPATINVTVTVQFLSVSTTGPIAFGIVSASSETVSTSASTVTNDGNATVTYDLKLTEPTSWTAGVPGDEIYRLSAQFNVAAPTAVSFTAEHDLTTSNQTSSGTIFAGDQTGLSVAASAERSLWFKFEAPTSTTETAEQTIVVTITAVAA